MEKTVEQSKLTLSQLMRPQHSNFGGKVHGGTLLSLIDEAAYACATKYSEAYCVTASMDQIDFLAPVDVGDVVTLGACVYRVGRTSMDIGVTIECENPRDPSSRRRTNECFVTMVAVNEAGKPKRVPHLVLKTDHDRERHCEAELRRRLRAEHRASLAAGACETTLSE